MRNVYLAQVNYRFGNNVFLPYSVGCLQAYAQSIPAIKANYTFQEALFLREPPAQVVTRMDNPAVLGLSCYQWNWRWNEALARAVKAKWPSCFIIVGGPQVPAEVDKRVDWADMEIVGEGEFAFAGALLALLKNRPVASKTHLFRVDNLDELPSPYLTSVFDPLLDKYPYNFHATSETHRGCPYQCTFCDWGSAIYTKVRPFSELRVIQEYLWMSRQKIELVYNADANFAMLKRDSDLIDFLIDLKAERGYPKQIRAAWAKNSTKKTFQIAHKLQQAGMNKGVTLALQSLHEPTLKAIKRQNIRWADWQALAKQYQESSVATYTELILGLPEETLDSFRSGVDQLLDAGQHNGLNIYYCSLLPNSEMSLPAYRAKYGLRSVELPLLQPHASVDPNDIQEYGEYVTATNSMGSILSTATFAWAVQAFHSLGLTRQLAQAARAKGTLYSDFYDSLLTFISNLPADHWLKQEYSSVRGTLTYAYSRALTDPRFGNIWWPIEEMTYLRIMAYGVEWFYIALEPWLKSLGLDNEIDTQLKMLRTPDEFGGDLETYAREVVWYGRKGGFFLKDPIPA